MQFALRLSTRAFVSTLILVVVLAMALLVPRVQAIGISPPIIQATDILRNSAQSYSVSLLIQDPAPYDMYFSAEPRGEYGHYLKGASEVVIPQGKTSVVYDFELEPIDAAIGSYNLQLAFTEKQKAAPSENGAEGGAKVVVLQGAILVISMGVTGEERVSYEITRAQFEDTEPRIPLIGTYTVRNTGNVEWKPDRIEVEAYEVADPENKAMFEVKSEAIPLVKPGKVLDAKISLGHKLTEGRYRAKVRFYYKDAMIQELETPPFSVFQVGTLDQAGELVEVTTNKTTYNVGEQVVLRGLFKNTGDVTVEGQLETQVYKDGAFVNLEVSRTLNIDRRQETVFEQFIKMNEPGEYTLEVAATYGTRKTPAQKITITVQSGTLSAVGNMYITIALLSLFVIGVIIFLILFARRKKKEQAQAGGAVVAPIAQPVAAVTSSPAVPATPIAVPAVAPLPTPVPAAPAPAPIPVVTPQEVPTAPLQTVSLEAPVVPALIPDLPHEVSLPNLPKVEIPSVSEITSEPLGKQNPESTTATVI